MDKESNVGMENVAGKSRKTKNEDPLPFLRKGTTKFPFESSTSVGGQAAKGRAIALGPMDKIFQKERWKSLVSPLPSSSIKTSYHLMLHAHLYLLRCAEL